MMSRKDFLDILDLEWPEEGQAVSLYSLLHDEWEHNYVYVRPHYEQRKGRTVLRHVIQETGDDAWPYPVVVDSGNLDWDEKRY
tara:strand:- start:1876 stop:2124 length:249 start_codon:yes stop_codon:yes gene_type:complete